MLRLSSVIAATNDRESRIGDERDDREPTLHEVRTYLEHAPEAREETYVVDDEGFAFGFEFLKRATFRQVNFGPRDPNASLRVDGEAISDWTSLIAAIERGLVEYYRSDVGHLRARSRRALSRGRPSADATWTFTTVCPGAPATSSSSCSRRTS
jgi:hypothetical protein